MHMPVIGSPAKMEEVELMTLIPEFSREIDAGRVGSVPLTLSLVATDVEREALARRFGLLAIKSLHAQVVLKAEPGSTMIAASGQWHAHVVQCCVVSLEPVSSVLDGPVEALFAPEDIVEAAIVDVDPFMIVPEPFENGRMDIGELVAQHLAMGLDPYPRGTDVVDDMNNSTNRALIGPLVDAAGVAAKGPFAVLASWGSRD